MRQINWKNIGIALFICIFGVTIAGCGSANTKSSARDTAQKTSDQLQSEVYQTKHNIDFRNYNLRQKMSDDPSTIVWCTYFPPGVQGVTNGSSGGQAFTVPVAGKLTSSNKRPFDTTKYTDAGNYSWYPHEQPGPDHMYGSSSEYRYGFDPTLTTYYDFTSLASFCTTEPTVWQTQQTKIVVQTDKTLSNLTAAAEKSIKAGNPKQALDLLKQAETSSDDRQAK